jgi:hypothetical protein
MYGSVRGAEGNLRPYRDPLFSRPLFSPYFPPIFPLFSPLFSPVGENVPRTANRAKVACRSASG